MSPILIHTSVRDVLLYLDKSIALKVFQAAEDYLAGLSLLQSRLVDSVEERAVEIRIELFREQCLAVFMTSAHEQIFVFYAHSCRFDDFAITDEAIDESQNFLQAMYDGLNTLQFKI